MVAHLIQPAICVNVKRIVALLGCRNHSQFCILATTFPTGALLSLTCSDIFRAEDNDSVALLTSLFESMFCLMMQ
ncbi:hypothetical protein VIGAN_05197200, partial [Vigna angularis var. angularis]